jgi:hypothetical protein
MLEIWNGGALGQLGGQRRRRHFCPANKKPPYFRFLPFTLIESCAIFGIENSNQCQK